MKTRRAKILALLVIVGTLAALAALAEDGKGRNEDGCPRPSASTPVPTGDSGFRAYVDPRTGEFAVPKEPPASPLATPATAPADRLATSHEGLTPIRGTTRAGGWVVDLRGRFRSAMVATVAPDGSVTARCVTVSASPAPAPAQAGPACSEMETEPSRER